MSEPVPAQPQPERDVPPEPDALAVCDALNDFFMDHVDPRDHAGVAAHEEMFGSSGLHAALVALGKMRNDYKGRFTDGEVRVIADMAITSGHEAVACFADRVASYARVRRSSIPRNRHALEAVQAKRDTPEDTTEVDTAAVASCKVALHQAAEDFATAMRSALTGWPEHYKWIRRSIEKEREVTQKHLLDRLVTVEEAAALLNEPDRSIRNWIGRKNDPVAPVDQLGGPRSTARRYLLGDILARRPKTRD